VPIELVVALVDPQSFEELVVALKKFRDGAEQECLAETPWTGHETIVQRVTREHFIDILGLVGVDAILSSNSVKRTIGYR
jgi:hypothetical protein